MIRIPAKWLLTAVGWVLDRIIARQDEKVRRRADEMVTRARRDAKTTVLPDRRGKPRGDFER